LRLNTQYFFGAFRATYSLTAGCLRELSLTLGDCPLIEILRKSRVVFAMELAKSLTQSSQICNEMTLGQMDGAALHRTEAI
jgi:hypothetical protein